MYNKNDLIKLVDEVKAVSSNTKQIITYVHQYERDFYFRVYGNSVEYIQLPEKVIIKS